MPRKRKAPAYTLHSGTGQARCRIDGTDHYLGLYGTPESRERYDELIAEWLSKQDSAHLSLAVDDLCLLYFQHAQAYYRRRDGAVSSEIAVVRHAFRHLIKLHGRCRVREFGPLKLKEVRAEMIKAGLCRTNINRQVHRIRRAFKWGVENEMLPAAIYQALCAVEALKVGRSEAREAPPVKPVDESVVQQTLPYLSPIVADMVRLQLLCGMRPGEVCLIRPCDVSPMTDGAWLYRPMQHKTEHHGKDRRIYIGPQGQAVLKPYLNRGSEEFCFSPAEADEQRKAEKRGKRKTPFTPSQLVRVAKKRKLQERYSKDSYNRAIQRGCELAFDMPAELRDARNTVVKTTGIDEATKKTLRKQLNASATEWRREHCWSPNQLRHTRATAIREKYGIEAAQTVLGHSDFKVTAVYAERDFAMAARIMREIG